MSAPGYGVIIAVALGLAYWLLVSTEGTYLGPRVVALLYDWAARSYDRIKNVHFVDEARHIGIPLADRLKGRESARVLDLACGTGRVALALRLGGGYEGFIAGLDRSPGMLAICQAETEAVGVPIALQRGDGHHLPFVDGCMDAVTCLEALEFFGRPAQVLAECLRVLRPGGILLTSNRIGWQGRVMPFRYTGRGRQEALLYELGFALVDTERWQVHYDLIWAIKPQTAGQEGEETS